MGGPAHHVALLSGRRFHPDRYETLLVHGTLAPGEASLASVAEAEGATMLQLEDLVQPISPRSDLRAYRRLRETMREFRPDIIHTHTAKAGLLGRQAALGGEARASLVHTFHGHVLDGYFGTAKSRLFRGLERRLARRTDRLIGVSEATVDDLVRLGIAPRERFQVVRLGLDLQRFAAVSGAERNDARRSIGAEPGDVVCTFAGRIAPIKRVDLLLTAFAEAEAVGSGRLRLVVVGDGELRPDLERTALELGISDRVEFLGYREELAPIWSATDIAVLASANEGTPVSLIEAAAAGVPAVATDVGGVRETVAERGAILVPAGDTHALAVGIAEMGADQDARRARGEAARAHVLARFGVERLIADLDRLYTSLVDGRDP